MKNVKEFMKEAGVNPLEYIKLNKRGYSMALEDFLTEYASHVLDEAAERAEVEGDHLDFGQVKKSSILDLKNEL